MHQPWDGNSHTTDPSSVPRAARINRGVTSLYQHPPVGDRNESHASACVEFRLRVSRSTTVDTDRTPRSGPQRDRSARCACARAGRTGRRGAPGSAGRHPGRARRPRRETSPGWAVASVTTGCSPRRRDRSASKRPPSPVAVCGSSSDAGPARGHARDLVERGVVVERGPHGTLPSTYSARWSGLDHRVGRSTRKRCELLGGETAVAPVHLEQQALEVRRDLDVHRSGSASAPPRGSTCHRRSRTA